MKLTTDQQIAALKTLTPEWAIHQQSGVAGGRPWTPHEFVTHMLDTIFEPNNWSAEIIGELKTVETPAHELVMYAPVKMTARFADGSIAIRSDIGVSNVHKVRGKTDLSETPAENYETGIKDVVTSGIKGCARDLGRIFVPMQNGRIADCIKHETFEAELEIRLALREPGEPGKVLAEGRRILGRDDGDLVGATTQPAAPELPAPTPETPAPATPAPKPQPSGNGKQATIKTPAWANAATALSEKLVKAGIAYYQGKDGKANLYHMAGSAAKCGYSEVTNDNLVNVMRDLEQHAREQTEEVPF